MLRSGPLTLASDFLLPVDFPSVAAIIIGSVSVVPEHSVMAARFRATVGNVLEELAVEARVGKADNRCIRFGRPDSAG